MAEEKEHEEVKKETDEQTGYHRVTCRCSWQSKWEYFLGHARTELYRHLDEVSG